MHPGKLLLAAWAAVLVAPVVAQYKIIAAQGRVTYTDRPPATEGSKVLPMSGGVAAAALGR